MAHLRDLFSDQLSGPPQPAPELKKLKDAPRPRRILFGRSKGK